MFRNDREVLQALPLSKLRAKQTKKRNWNPGML
uniref:Uncharacterized protein n=1 Tax=Anguilla anguilla TaxID=7936 RepID=A0A0E9QMZ5_ANGAN